ncbi:MAG: hypothetical protein ACFFFG_07420 [Candidatus Thorarchaeota archaeon]
MMGTQVKKKRKVFVLVLAFFLFSGIPLFIRLYNFVQLSAAVPLPTEWRNIYSATDPTGHWSEVESVRMGVVDDSIFFHIRWQSVFPQNLSQGDPFAEHFWRQDRLVGIEWSVKNESYSLELRKSPPSPETGELSSWISYSFLRNGLWFGSQLRLGHQVFNLTDGIVGFRLTQDHLLFGPSPLSVPWEESDTFAIYSGMEEICDYVTSSKFHYDEIPLVSTPPTNDGEATEWKASDKKTWDLITYQSQSPNPLHSISLVRSSIGIHVLLEFHTPYLKYLNDLFPNYNLSIGLGSVLIASGTTLYEYNLNRKTETRETISLPSSIFAINRSIELTYKSENIKEIWNSDEIWDIGIRLAQSLRLTKAFA